jgi:hypothetical protein
MLPEADGMPRGPQGPPFDGYFPYKHRHHRAPPGGGSALRSTTMPWRTLVKPPRRADLDAILQRWLVDERPPDATLLINLQHHLTARHPHGAQDAHEVGETVVRLDGGLVRVRHDHTA